MVKVAPSPQVLPQGDEILRIVPHRHQPQQQAEPTCAFFNSRPTWPGPQVSVSLPKVGELCQRGGLACWGTCSDAATPMVYLEQGADLVGVDCALHPRRTEHRSLLALLRACSRHSADSSHHHDSISNLGIGVVGASREGPSSLQEVAQAWRSCSSVGSCVRGRCGHSLKLYSTDKVGRIR